MNTFTASLKVHYPKTLQAILPNCCEADIYLDGVKIGECRVWTAFNHCFENDYFGDAYKVINAKLVQITCLSPSEAGTIGAYNVEYTFL